VPRSWLIWLARSENVGCMTSADDAPYGVQLCVDCHHPHVLADWWAETLQWNVEPQDADFIRSMIDQGFAKQSDAIKHQGKLVWREGAAINPPEGSPTSGLRVLFQEVPEAKQIKNRLHLDLRIGDASVDEVREQLLARGATKIGENSQGPHTWWILTDPEGNEFCL
jgi:Glyoxalase-like domain